MGAVEPIRNKLRATTVALKTYVESSIWIVTDPDSKYIQVSKKKD